MLPRRLPLRRRHLTLILSAVLAFVVLGLAVSHQAFAKEPTNIINAAANGLSNAIFLILNTIIWAITKMFALLTYVFISILIVVARYNTFLNAPVVVSGWPIVRDLMNMVFIIALIVIAAGTVLRLQNYRYNRLLGKLIIMAFLVNFSKFIAVFLLQFAQVVMLTFVNAFREAAFGNFSSMFGLDDVFKFSVRGTFTNSFTDQGGFSLFISMLAGLVMMIVAFVVVLAMTVMLFVRIIALWLLIIMSPIAYALRILPNTEKYASQWWSEFTKYAVLGPVLAFFLWLALAVVAATPTCTQAGCNNPLGSDPAVKADLGAVDSDSANLRGDLVTNLLGVDKMVTFVVSIIFLMMGLQYAQKSGAAGAAFAGKVAQTGFGAAAAVTGYNAIKDRTVAPIQGWMKNRAAARQAAIQERTESVEAAGDRVKARFGPTQKGREEGRAAANAYERSRTPRTAQKQGFKDMNDDALQEKFLNSTNRRERMAAMTELANRGKVDTRDKAQNDAFEYLTNYRRETVAGVLPKFPLADAELPWGERQQLRDKILEQNMRSEDEGTLRGHAGRIGKDENEDLAIRDRRTKATQELDRRQLLKASNPADVALIEQLERDVKDSPEKHRQFKESLMKSNPDMAMRVLFKNLKRTIPTSSSPAAVKAAADADRLNLEAYKSAIQQKQISTSSMNMGLHDSIDPADAATLMNHLIEISPDAETLQGYLRPMEPEAARKFSRHIKMRPGATLDERNMVAKATGEWDLAYQDEHGNPLKKQKADGSGPELDDKDREILLGQDYFDKLGSSEVLKTLTPESIKSARVQEMIRRSPNWTFPDSATLRTRSSDSRKAQAEGLQGALAEILARHSGAQGADGKINFAKITNENEKSEVISMAQQLFLATKGETNPYDMTPGTQGAKLFASTISGAKATDYSKIDKSADYEAGDEAYKKAVRVAIGRNGSPGQLSDLLLMEREFAVQVLENTEDVLTDEIKGDDKAVAGKAHNVLRRLANQEGFNNIIKYNPAEYRGASSESDKDTGGGGKTAAAAAAAGAAGAVVGAAAAKGRGPILDQHGNPYQREDEEPPEEPPTPPAPSGPTPPTPDTPPTPPTGGTPAPRGSHKGPKKPGPSSGTPPAEPPPPTPPSPRGSKPPDGGTPVSPPTKPKTPEPAPAPTPKAPATPPVRPAPQPKAAEPKAAAPVKPAPIPTPPPTPPTRPPETTPTASTPQRTQETVGPHREVDDVLARLASAKAEEMGALREVFEKGVKHLEQTSIAGAREGAKAIRDQFERLPHGGTGGVDHETQKRLFREFGEELKRTLRKNPTGSATTKGASPTTAPRPTPSKPAKPKA